MSQNPGAHARAFLIDSNNVAHLVFEEPSGAVFHCYKIPSQPWSAPVELTTATYELGFCPTEHYWRDNAYTFLQEDLSGMLHVFFEQSPGSTQDVWHRQLDLSNLAGGWSAGVNISQSLGVDAFGRAILIDSNSTVHVIVFTPGSSHLYHTYRQTAGSWSNPTLIDVIGTNAELAATPLSYGFFAEAPNDSMIVFYTAEYGGVRQLWHSKLSKQVPSSGWTAPFNVSQSSDHVTPNDFVIDSEGRMHVIFYAGSPWAGYHSYAGVGVFDWTPPQLLTNPGVQANPGAHTHYRFLQEDGAKRLHVVYETDLQTKVWHRSLDVTFPSNGWSPPVQISDPGATFAFTMGMFVHQVGSNHIVHVLLDTNPGGGPLQLYHTYEYGSGWSTPGLVSTAPGSASLANGAPGSPFLTSGPADKLHVFWNPIPVGGELWHSELDLSGCCPAGSWSTPVEVAGTTDLIQQSYLVVHSNDALSVFFQRYPPSTSESHIMHVAKPVSMGWQAPVQINPSSQKATIPWGEGYYFATEDLLGNMHFVYDAEGSPSEVWHTQVPVDWLSAVSDVPLPGIRMSQNQPNPFNPGTMITYELPAGGDVVLAVYDVAGRRVAVIDRGVRSAGLHEARWDGRNSHGQPVGSGVYFCRLTVNGQTATRKMTLLK